MLNLIIVIAFSDTYPYRIESFPSIRDESCIERYPFEVASIIGTKILPTRHCDWTVGTK